MKTAAVFLGLLLAPIVAGAEESYLHQSVGVTMLVADADQAADGLEAWAEAQDGYLLYKSRERVSLRLPHGALPRLRGFLEELSEDILDFSPQAVDLREQLARTQSSLASRREILGRNLALLDQADTAGTLAIEREMLALVQEVESLQAALARLNVDRDLRPGGGGHALRAGHAARGHPLFLPLDQPGELLPIHRGPRRPGAHRPPARLRPPAGYAEAGAGQGRQLPGPEPGGPALPRALLPERTGERPGLLGRGAEVAPDQGRATGPTARAAPSRPATCPAAPWSGWCPTARKATST